MFDKHNLQNVFREGPALPLLGETVDDSPHVVGDRAHFENGEHLAHEAVVNGRPVPARDLKVVVRVEALRIRAIVDEDDVVHLLREHLEVLPALPLLRVARVPVEPVVVGNHRAQPVEHGLRVGFLGGGVNVNAKERCHFLKELVDARALEHVDAVEGDVEELDSRVRRVGRLVDERLVHIEDEDLFEGLALARENVEGLPAAQARCVGQRLGLLRVFLLFPEHLPLV